jgi:hypothetical protein
LASPRIIPRVQAILCSNYQGRVHALCRSGACLRVAAQTEAAEVVMSEQSQVTTEAKASVSVFAWLWQRTNTVLAIIGLASVFEDSVRWATAIHWVVEQYRVIRDWLFGWLPFRIPETWQDFTVLVLIWFSVTSAGYYSATRKWYPILLLRVLYSVILAELLSWLAAPFVLISKVIRVRVIRRPGDYLKNLEAQKWEYADSVFEWRGDELPTRFMNNINLFVIILCVVGMVSGSLLILAPMIGLAHFQEELMKITLGLLLFIFWFISRSLLAWRWLLWTCAVFGGLPVVNELYVRVLQPMAY